MATQKDVRARAPRGTKNVTQAFFEAIESLPAAQQDSVASAALAGIRDELKSRRLKTREAAARAKAKVKARGVAKAPAKAKEPASRTARPAAAKRRGATAAAAERKHAVAATTRAPKKLPAKAVKRKQVRKPVAPPVTETDSE
jgi:cell wall-associated NlpC family hydrolase